LRRVERLFGPDVGAVSLAVSAALINALWQDAIVALLLWATLAALRSSPARIRYAAACVALATMALLPIATALLLYMQDAAVAFTTVPSSVTPAVFTPALGVGAAWAMRVSSSPWTAALQTSALPLWSVGVLLFSLRLVASAAHTHVLRRHSEAAEDGIASVVARMAERVGVHRRVRVFVCALVSGPSTIGWVRPVILVPPATLLGLTTQQLEAVIAHELAHVRRHDYAVNVAQMVIETLFFYHPAVWWASRRIRTERELCCDDIAVATCGDPVEYASALTHLARVRTITPRLALRGAGGPLLQRVQRLLAPVAPVTASRVPIAVALSLAFATTTFGHAWIGAESRQVPPAAARGTVTGIMYDPLGEPAARVPLTLDNNVDSGDSQPLGTPVLVEEYTDANGRYRFDNIPPGAYVITPAISWAQASAVSVPSGGTIEHDVRIAFDTVHSGLVMIPGGRPPSAYDPFPRRAPESATLSLHGPRHLRAWNRPYPDALLPTHREGVVVVEGWIGADGAATALQVISADHPELEKAALMALQEERWEPARVRGVAIEVPLRVTLEYRLALR
jgi:TonB family protein